MPQYSYLNLMRNDDISFCSAVLRPYSFLFSFSSSNSLYNIFARICYIKLLLFLLCCKKKSKKKNKEKAKMKKGIKRKNENGNANKKFFSLNESSFFAFNFIRAYRLQICWLIWMSISHWIFINYTILLQ